MESRKRPSTSQQVVNSANNHKKTRRIHRRDRDKLLEKHVNALGLNSALLPDPPSDKSSDSRKQRSPQIGNTYKYVSNSVFFKTQMPVDESGIESSPPFQKNNSLAIGPLLQATISHYPVYLAPSSGSYPIMLSNPLNVNSDSFESNVTTPFAEQDLALNNVATPEEVLLVDAQNLDWLEVPQVPSDWIDSFDEVLQANMESFLLDNSHLSLIEEFNSPSVDVEDFISVSTQEIALPEFNQYDSADQIDAIDGDYLVNLVNLLIVDMKAGLLDVDSYLADKAVLKKYLLEPASVISAKSDVLRSLKTLPEIYLESLKTNNKYMAEWLWENSSEIKKEFASVSHENEALNALGGAEKATGKASVVPTSVWVGSYSNPVVVSSPSPQKSKQNAKSIIG